MQWIFFFMNNEIHSLTMKHKQTHENANIPYTQLELLNISIFTGESILLSSPIQNIFLVLFFRCICIFFLIKKLNRTFNYWIIFNCTRLSIDLDLFKYHTHHQHVPQCYVFYVHLALITLIEIWFPKVMEIWFIYFILLTYEALHEQRLSIIFDFKFGQVGNFRTDIY